MTHANLTEIKNHILSTPIGKILPKLTHRGRPMLSDDLDYFSRKGLIQQFNTDRYYRIY